MNPKNSLRTLLCLLTATASVPAQSQATPLPNGATPAPHRQPAHLAPSWILQFTPLDLAPLRDAYTRRAGPARIANIVEELATAARARQAAAAEKVVALGGRVIRSWWLVNAIQVELPAHVAAAMLDDLPGVTRVEANRPIRGTTVPRAPLEKAIDAQGHNAIAAHAAGWTGSARGGENYQSIAVLDSELLASIDPFPAPARHHATLHEGGLSTNQTRVIAEPPIPGSLYTSAPFDHGTSTAAIAAGAVQPASGPTFEGSSNGHAPAADLVSVNIAIDAPTAPGEVSITPTSSTATLISGWQWVTANAGAFGIRVAVNSFGGDPDPAAAVQQVLDACADVADVLVVVPSGNTGDSVIQGTFPFVPNPVWDSQYAINGVTVGATLSHNREVPDWVSFGPLTPITTTQPAGSTNQPTPAGYEREYPDLVAAGIDIQLPALNDETDSIVVSGTSLAAPQVAGSAFLWLVGPDSSPTLPARTSLMAKAALLAGSEDITAANPTGPASTFDGGFLRSDWITRDAATFGAFAEEEALDVSTGARRTRTMPVVAGRTYSVAIAWKRVDYSATPDWANLDLEVSLGGQVLGSSASSVGTATQGVRRTWERVTFTAPSSGTATIVTQFRYVPVGLPVTYAFASTELPEAGAPGSTRARFEEIATSPGANCATAGLGGSGAQLGTTNSSGGINYVNPSRPRNLEAGDFAFQTNGVAGSVIEFSFRVDSPSAGTVECYSYSGGGVGSWNPCSTGSAPNPTGGTILDSCLVEHGAGEDIDLTGRILAGGYLIIRFPATMRWWDYRPNITSSQFNGMPWSLGGTCQRTWPHVAWSGTPGAGATFAVGTSPWSFNGPIMRWLYPGPNGTAVPTSQPPWYPDPFTHWQFRFTYRAMSTTALIQPELTTFGTPRIGANFGTLCSGSFPNTPTTGFLTVGLWNPFATPVNVPITGSTCNFLVAQDLFIASSPSTNGYRTALFAPNDPGLAGFGFELQQLLFDTSSVPASSNAVRAVLGF